MHLHRGRKRTRVNRRAALPLLALCGAMTLTGLSGCNIDKSNEKLRLNSDPGSYQKELSPRSEQPDRLHVRSADKLSAELRGQRRNTSPRRLRVRVRDAKESGHVAHLVASLGGRVMRMGNQSNDLIIELTMDQLPALTKSPSVVWVEPGPPPA